MLRYVADFETNNHAEACRVWGAGIAEIPATQHGTVNVQHFNNMKDFLSFLSNQEKTHEVYFHNLKFDAQFLIHELLSNGFTYDENLSESENMKKNGFMKVYDCGNLVYEMNFSPNNPLTE